MRARNRAFTLVEIMIVILIIGVLLSIAIPSFVTSRARARQRTCVSSLKQLNSAKEQFALEHNLSDGGLVTSGDITPTYIREYPYCPEGGVYTLNPIGTNPECTKMTGPYAHVLP
jgi:prepilin-type N-terminal cleavage/methylation domain-containing protein